MTECERNESLLSSWVDGEDVGGAGPERLEVLDHLVRCDDCRTFYREARALDGLVAGVRAPKKAEPLDESLWVKIRDAANLEGRSRWSRMPGWALRAAALVLVGLGIAFALSAPPPGGTLTEADIEVVLEEAADDMTEARFVELTTEVMRADRRFHFAMLDVMQQVVEDTEGRETPDEERGSKEGGDNGDNDGEGGGRKVV